MIERPSEPDQATEEFWRDFLTRGDSNGAQGPPGLPSPAARAPLHVVRGALRRACGTGHAGDRQAPVGQEPDDVHVVLRFHGEAPRRRRDRVQLPVRRRPRVHGHRRAHVAHRVPRPARPLLRARDHPRHRPRRQHRQVRRGRARGDVLPVAQRPAPRGASRGDRPGPFPRHGTRATQAGPGCHWGPAFTRGRHGSARLVRARAPT